ncbi:uncharacterized protein LOC120075353 isoform X1 [Benincasa hispida]|uniref:uncharacterized protein LOC120075353 isoform X1 n=1 Tax=Benincasa hispida TaxID=102211 RepID=UPI0019002F4F|nr:uncharacterized protein LOC120075353 isoform X1 [Benincasa hispida]
MASAGEYLSQMDISEEEKDKLVAEAIRYIIFKTHQSSGCPIKREELTQLVTKNYRNRGLPAVVIDEAKKKLSSIFGYELRELQRTRLSSTGQAHSSQQNVADAKSYVLISKLPADIYRRYVEDVNTAHMTGFTFVVVSIVHLAGGKIPEESLWHHLRRMGLSESDENHPVLGNIKHAAELVVQQRCLFTLALLCRYLQKVKVNAPEGNITFYELAERAIDGPVSEKIKEYVAQIVNTNVTAADS